jgi:hypothetical protein
MKARPRRGWRRRGVVDPNASPARADRMESVLGRDGSATVHRRDGLSLPRQDGPQSGVMFTTTRR